MISIIITVYNKSKYIAKAIESAINQTYNDKEIIVVDDGSTDNSVEIIKKYNNKIRFFEKLHSGIGGTINFGIKKAQGEWIKLLSGDDLLEKDALKNLMLNVEKFSQNDQTIFYSHWKKIDADGKLLRLIYEPQQNSENLWNGHFVNFNTTLLHKKLFEKVGYFDESLKNSEDYEWLLRAVFLHHISLKVLDLVTASYRINNTQTWPSAPPFWEQKIAMKFRQKMNNHEFG